jgi:branched-chain amino acid transport system permease protein
METLVQQLINGLSLGATYALIALGYTMVYGVLRLINFAHGDVYMIGAFAGYFLAQPFRIDNEHPGSIFEAIVVTLGAMAVCAALGVLIERFAYRPVRHHSRLTSLITAIGVSLLLEYGGQVVFSANPRGFPPLIEAVPIRFGEVQTTNQYVLVIVVSVLLMIGLELIVHRTRIGKAMRATSYNLSVAKLMGINTNLIIAFTFALGSALAAAAGVMVPLANQQQIEPLMGLQTGLKAFVAAVLGGIGNIPGAMLGGLIIGLLEASIKATAYSTYADAVAFSILILILLFRPAGILGTAVTEKV